MKKKFLVMIIMLFGVVILGGCRSGDETEALSSESEGTEEALSEETEEGSDISEVSLDQLNIGVLQGPTAMGMVGPMHEADQGNLGALTYNFTLAGSPDEVVPKLVQGNLDIASVPSNLASILYNNTDGAIQVIAINTLGVLHIVEAGDSISQVEDLRGRTIYASGNSSTPEFVLNYILEGNGLDPHQDVEIEWLAEHTEVVARLEMNENAVAMLPQPFVTIAQTQNEDIQMALDLTAEWDQVQAANEGPTSALIMGVLVAQRELIETYPELINEFLNQYANSVEFVNGAVEEAAELIAYYDIFPAPIATRAIPHSNITFIAGAEMQALFEGYLAVLFEQSPETIGGEMPSDDFYYIP